MKKQSKILASQEFAVFCFTLAVVLAFVLLSTSFATVANFCLILSQVSINGICAIGVSMVVFLGGIDLSSGAILALCTSCSGMFVNMGIPVFFCILMSMAIGVLCGLFNGALVARLRIPPIIATMASMNIFRGIAIVVTKGDWITGFPKYFNTLGQGRICGIPIPFWIFAIITASCGILMKYFNIGRKIYAVGGNINAAELAGMDVVRTKLIAYMISGGLIGLAGTVYASMVGTISASTTGSSLGFQILASALIGGMSINGGKGTVIGTFLGVMLLGVISNGLILSRVSEYWIDTVTGSIIIVALSINAIKNLRNQRSVMI